MTPLISTQSPSRTPFFPINTNQPRKPINEILQRNRQARSRKSQNRAELRGPPEYHQQDQKHDHNLQRNTRGRAQRAHLPAVHGGLSDERSDRIIDENRDDGDRQDDQNAAQPSMYERPLFGRNHADPLAVCLGQLRFVVDAFGQNDEGLAIRGAALHCFQYRRRSRGARSVTLSTDDGG